jgi:hypothetical protein
MKRSIRITKALKKATAELGRIGGEARAKLLTPARRREIAIKANRAASRARVRKAQERSAS